MELELFFCPSLLPFGGSTVLRLTRGPAGNRTTTGSLSAPSRTTPYQLSHEDTSEDGVGAPEPAAGELVVGERRSIFFLRYGRSRSKARSLHEKKLLLRKLLHGHRWSHVAWQIIKTKTQTKTENTRQDADPPARFASHHPRDSKANSERGRSPTETTTKDLPRTQW